MLRRLLLLIALMLVVPACASEAIDGQCETITFFNGVSIRIHEEKILAIGGLLEQQSGNRIESVSVELPPNAIFTYLHIYPYEPEYPIDSNCRAADENKFCVGSIPEMQIWFSFYINAQVESEDAHSVIDAVSRYLASGVVCVDD